MNVRGTSMAVRLYVRLAVWFHKRLAVWFDKGLALRLNVRLAVWDHQRFRCIGSSTIPFAISFSTRLRHGIAKLSVGVNGSAGLLKIHYRSKQKQR